MTTHHPTYPADALPEAPAWTPKEGEWTRFKDALPEVGAVVQVRSGGYGSRLVLWDSDHAWDAALGAYERWRYPDPAPSQVEAIERDVLRRVARALRALDAWHGGEDGSAVPLDMLADTIDDTDPWRRANRYLRAEGLPVGGEDG